MTEAQKNLDAIESHQKNRETLVTGSPWYVVRLAEGVGGDES